MSNLVRFKRQLSFPVFCSLLLFINLKCQSFTEPQALLFLHFNNIPALYLAVPFFALLPNINSSIQIMSTLLDPVHISPLRSFPHWEQFWIIHVDYSYLYTTCFLESFLKASIRVSLPLECKFHLEYILHHCIPQDLAKLTHSRQVISIFWVNEWMDFYNINSLKAGICLFYSLKN